MTDDKLYGIRRAEGHISWPDSDGEVRYLDSDGYIHYIAANPENIRPRLTPGERLVSRTWGPIVVEEPPLPTTVGSVIRATLPDGQERVILVRSVVTYEADHSGGSHWERVTRPTTANPEYRFRPESLSAVEVLFEAPA